ncbi:MAG: hypothetical protein LBQ54_02485 [Planctomycetaceae bacterium]|jgi:hypothetical protein|nr:hypothetical protein [Planctomycetaceae bacterium]
MNVTDVYDSDGLLTLLKGEKTFIPMIDRTPLNISLSTLFFIAALYLLYRAFRIKICKREPDTADKKYDIRQVLLKITLILVAFFTIFFSVVSKRTIFLLCTDCCVWYEFDEYRIFGKLVKLDHFITTCQAQDILCMKRRNGYCFHHYEKTHCTKYWGCLIPTREYHIGNFYWAGYSGTAYDEPYVITNIFKYIDARDEFGRRYTKVYTKGELMYEGNRLQSQADLRNRQEPEQNQAPVQEMPDTQLEFPENMPPSSDPFENQLKSFDSAEEESNESSETSDEFETDENKKEDK